MRTSLCVFITFFCMCKVVITRRLISVALVSSGCNGLVLVSTIFVDDGDSGSDSSVGSHSDAFVIFSVNDVS